MTAVVTTSSTSDAVRAAVSRRDQSETNADMSLSEADFSRLLESAIDPAAYRQASRGSDASAQLMFEGEPSDARARNAASLKEDARQAGLAAEARGKEARLNSESRHAPTSGQLPAATDTAPAREPVDIEVPATFEATPQGGGAGIAVQRHDVRSLPKPSGHEGRAPQVGGPVSPSVPLAGTAVAPQPVVTTASRSSSAGQVAKILSAAPQGDGSSARAAHQAGQMAQAERGRSEGAKSVPQHARGARQQAGDSSATVKTAFDDLVKSIRLQAAGRTSTAKMRLDPPELGTLLVDVRMERDELEIKVRVESASARDLLLERSAQLRSALQQAGIQVDRFDVTADLAGDSSFAAFDGMRDEVPAERQGGRRRIGGGAGGRRRPDAGSEPTPASVTSTLQGRLGTTRLDVTV